MAELEAHQVTGRKSNNALHSTSTRACLPCERGFFVGAFCLFESFLDCIVDVNELDVRQKMNPVDTSYLVARFVVGDAAPEELVEWAIACMQDGLESRTLPIVAGYTKVELSNDTGDFRNCLLYTSPSPRDRG